MTADDWEKEQAESSEKGKQLALQDKESP